MSMEPIGHISEYGLEKLKTRRHYCVSVSHQPEKEYTIGIVRLSDAEARIKALEADVQGYRDNNDDLATAWASERDRAEAAEALLKEAGPIIETFAQIGDYVLAEAPSDATMWYAGPFVDGTQMAQVSLEYFRAARSIAEKIGGKDE